MRKKLLSIAFAFLFSLAFFQFTGEAEAQNVLRLPSGSYGGVLENNRMQRGVNQVVGSSNFTESAINVIFSRENIFAANVVFGIIAIVYLVILGVKFTISEGKEEALTKHKKEFGFIIVGLFVLSIAQLAAFVYLNPDTSVNPGLLTNQNVVNAFEAKALQIKLFLQIIVGGIALLSVLTTAFRLMSSAGNEEVVSKEKQLIRNFLLAAVIIIGAEILVRGVFFIQGVDREGVSNQAVITGIREIIGIVNLLLTLVAGMAVFMVIIASLYYVTSLGDEERAGRAKRLIVSSIIAIFICISAYSLIRFFF